MSAPATAPRQRARGTIVLVVGPSGSGKDSIIAGAQAALAGDAGFCFPRREVTRPEALGHEPYRSVSAGEFHDRRASGAYSLTWSAHGLCYGIPCEIEAQLASGRHVVVNVSRSVIAEVRARLKPLCVVSVEVPRDVLRQRLTGRERESESEIEARLARAAAFRVEGPDVVRLRNDAELETAVGRFVTLLKELSPVKSSAHAP